MNQNQNSATHDAANAEHTKRFVRELLQKNLIDLENLDRLSPTTQAIVRRIAAEISTKQESPMNQPNQNPATQNDHNIRIRPNTFCFDQSMRGAVRVMRLASFVLGRPASILDLAVRQMSTTEPRGWEVGIAP